MISFEELKEKVHTHKDVLEYSEKMNPGIIPMFKAFMKKRIERYGEKGMYDWYCVPYYAYWASNFRYRYMVIMMPDNDTVFVTINYVSTGFVMFARLFGRPISANEVKANENAVLEYLFESGAVKNMQELTDEYNDDRFVDYYIKVPDRWEYINRSKWRSKNGINKFSGDIKLEVNNLLWADEMISLDNAWCESRGKDVEHKKLGAGAINYMFEYDKYVKYLQFSYNGIYLATVIISNEMDNYARTIYNKNLEALRGTEGQYTQEHIDKYLSEIDYEYEDIPEGIRKYLGPIVYYKMVEWMNKNGIEYAYIGNAYGGKNYLEVNKEKYYDRKIFHKLYTKDTYKEFDWE